MSKEEIDYPSLKADYDRLRQNNSQLQIDHTSLKIQIDQIMNYLQKGLVAFDYLLKIGAAVGVYLFPVAQEKVIQAVLVGVLGISTTLLSKGITRVKTFNAGRK